ncbi:MAG: acetylxylan esterase [Microbacterium sp.]|nr:acetylxylan esterase [Microbacterium sp.]
MTSFPSTQIHLAARPNGWPTHDDFETVTIENGPLQPGQVRVANLFVSVDPYMRGRMNDARSYVAPYALGETITGGAVGRVVESASDALPVGAAVLHQSGWTDTVQADAAAFRPVTEIPGVPLSTSLHILGMTGLTAYVGLTEIAPSLLSVALMDDIVLPSTVFAAFNAIPAEDKSIEVYEFNGHEGGGFHHWLRQTAWLAERF